MGRENGRKYPARQIADKAGQNGTAARRSAIATVNLVVYCAGIQHPRDVAGA
jgi:hypothetical protein